MKWIEAKADVTPQNNYIETEIFWDSGYVIANYEDINVFIPYQRPNNDAGKRIKTNVTLIFDHLHEKELIIISKSAKVFLQEGGIQKFGLPPLTVLLNGGMKKEIFR